MTMPSSFPKITPDVHPGTRHVENYNSILEGIHAFNHLSDVQLKKPGSFVTQSELNVLRQSVYDIASAHVYMSNFNPNQTYATPEAAEAIFHSEIRYDNPSYPNLGCFHSLGDKPLTKVPGEYTDTGKTIYGDDFYDVPILPIHFRELSDILNNLDLMDRINYGGYSGISHIHYDGIRYPNIETYPGIGHANPYNSSETYGSSPSAMTICDGYKTVFIYNEDNLPDGINELDTYTLIKRTFTTWETENSVPIVTTVYQWKKYSYDISDEDGITLGEIPEFLSNPDDYYRVGYSYKEDIKHVLCKVNSSASIKEDRNKADFNNNGVAVVGCFSCLVTRGLREILQQFFQYFGHVDRPLAISHGMESGLIIGHYLTKVDFQTKPAWHYNCNTGIVGDYRGSEDTAENETTSWHFTEILQARGNYVMMYWKTDTTAHPISGGDGKMSIEELIDHEQNSSAIWPSISFSDGIRHFYTTNGLVCTDEAQQRHQSPPGEPVSKIIDVESGSGGRRFMRWTYSNMRTSIPLPDVNEMVGELPLNYEYANNPSSISEELNGNTTFEIEIASGTWTEMNYQSTGEFVVAVPAPIAEGLLATYTSTPDAQLSLLRNLFNISLEISLTAHNVDQYTRNNAVEGYLSTYDFADGGRITSYWPTSSSNVLLQAEYYHSVPSDDPEETIEEKRGFQNGQPTVIQHIVRRLFPWGEEIVREITAPGTTVERVTEYFYGTDQTNAPNDYGKRIGERYYDGRWQRTHYDAHGRVSSVVTPFGHQTYDALDANCRVTEYDYTPCNATNEVLYSVDTRPRRIVEKIGGVEVSRKYFQYFADSEKEILCTVSGAAYDAVTNRVTLRTWYPHVEHDPSSGRVKSVLAPDGRKTEYSYAAGTGGNGLVTTEREGYGSGATIQYGTQTVTVQDANGYTVSRTRTDIASGIVLSQETYTNDNYGRAIRTDYLDGSYSTTTYDCCGPIATRNQDGETVTSTRDAFGRTVSEYRDGLWTRYLYTGEHQTGTSLAYEEVQPMEEFLTTTGYNAAGEVISETDRNGITTTYAEFPETVIDANEEEVLTGRWVKTTTHADGGTVIECYNADGSLYETKGTAAHPVRYEYSVVNGEIVSTAIYVNGNDLTHRESSVQNFAGDEYKQIYADNTFALTEFDADGRQVARVTPAGRRTEITYGADGRVASEAVVMGTGIDPLETLYAEGYRTRTLSDNTQVSVRYRETRRKQGSTVTLLSTEEGSVDGNWSFRIDQGGRITSTQRIRVEETVGNATMLRGKVKTRTVSPDNSAVEITTDYGRTIKEEHFDANGAVMYLALHAFDDFKREVTITEKASAAATAFRTTSLVYNSGSWSFVSSRTNNQENASFMYDNMGREYSSDRNGLIWSTTYYLTGEVRDRTCDPTSAPCDYRYTYNYFGAVATLSTCYQEQEYDSMMHEWTGTDSLGETQYFYNTRGFLTEKRYPDGNGTQYAYDADGRVTQRIWARGGTTSYTYDAAGRQIGISYSDNDTADISITYDHLDRPVSISDGSGTHTFTYNADGSLATEGSALISGLTLHYGYDVYGRPTSLEAKSGNTVLHSAVTTYNAQGRVATLNNAAHTWQAGTGLLTQTAAGSVPIFNTYNSSMELTGIYAEETLNIGYTYNSYTHLRTGMSCGDGQWSYQYDYHHYLASATRNNQPVTQLTYDQIGNRITCNNTHYRPNACNQYEDLSYDSDGNMTAYDGWALTWNGENRLIRMIKGTAKLEFAYDYMGRRYEKKVYANDVLTKHQRFIYDGYKLIEIRNALNNDALTHSFVWRKVPQDVPYSMKYGNTTYYYVTDANKNVVCLLSGYSSAADYQYGPWGEIREAEGIAADWNPFRFSSEYYDDETGLVYYNYRYYAPALGRWLSRDPIGEAGGMNLYAMVENNVINLFDLLGHIRGGGDYIIINLEQLSGNILRWNKNGRFASYKDFYKQINLISESHPSPRKYTRLQNVTLAIPGILYSYYLDVAEQELKKAVKNIGVLHLIQIHFGDEYKKDNENYKYEGQNICGGVIKDELINSAAFEIPLVEYPVKDFAIPVDLILALLNIPQVSVSAGTVTANIGLAKFKYRPELELRWRCISSSKLEWKINPVGMIDKPIISNVEVGNGKLKGIVSGICCLCKGKKI